MNAIVLLVIGFVVGLAFDRLRCFFGMHRLESTGRIDEPAGVEYFKCVRCGKEVAVD